MKMEKRPFYQVGKNNGSKRLISRRTLLPAWNAFKGLFVEELAAPKKSYRSSNAPAIINNVTVRPVARGSVDIQKWRNALILAEGEYDQRVLLYDLYEDMVLDGFLMDAIDKRVNDITNCSLQYVDANGKPADLINEILETTFFEDFLSEVMQSKFWGHSLMELDWGAPGTKTGHTHLIPRKHVKPRLGIVTREQWGMDGISYRELPNIIEVGKPNSLGRLLQVSQYVIYKRGGFGDWAEYAETFGTPFRWATYNNDESRKVLESALAQAGTAGYVVAPVDANLQFLNANPSGQGDMLFGRLRQACNEEISITILGNTMTTTEARSSGYAQSKTHAETQEAIHKADRRFVLRILTEKLTPYLERLGYPVNGGYWQYVDEEKLSLSERIAIDMQVATKVPIPNYYWYERYKIPAPTESDDTGEAAEEDEGEETPGDNQGARKKA
jgi:phage gp29-like protein